MKNRLFLTIVLYATMSTVSAQFDSLFLDQSLRIDYVHSGTDTTEWYALEALIREPYWGGSKLNLVDTFMFGNYYVEVFDKEDKLIYSRGYSSLFAEWQTTNEAKILSRNFFETVLIPYPKKKVKVVLSSRSRNSVFLPQFSLNIGPKDYFIKPAPKKELLVHDVLISNKPEKAVDIVILPDGYREEEMDKFRADCEKFREDLFRFEPFASNKQHFNIRAVLAPSKESGIAIPAKDFWPETAISSSFYTFDSERYCMTYDHKTLRDLAGQVPYDQIYILANTEKYGGGGIFNFYCLSGSSNRLSAEIIVHEFGHGFVGLGDEYYDSSTAYNDFYNLEIEPWEPNITTLVNFEKKWQHLIPAETPIPTPDEPQWDNQTGVFEGGGYSAKGIFRPSRDCLMHTFKGKVFCAACSEAIQKMINFYIE
jgi:hypothetical protein